MPNYSKRLLDEKIEKKLKSTGAILLKGVRFCGKTTTALHHAASSVRFDKSEMLREQAVLAPQIVLQGETPRLLDYVENIAYIDMRTLPAPPTPERIAALIRSLSRNISTEASLEKLAVETGFTSNSVMAASTVRKYLDQLSEIFVLEELPAWKTHIRSSVQQRIKPKWHFVDTSIATAALRILPNRFLNDFDCFGLFFESMAIRDLRIYADTLDGKVYHYRDSLGLEIDAVVELPNETWAAFEIKLGSTKSIDEAAENLQKFLTRLIPEKAAQCSSLNVLIAGASSYTRKDGVNVVSLGHLCA